jgi:hypothetical protein
MKKLLNFWIVWKKFVKKNYFIYKYIMRVLQTYTYVNNLFK